MTRELAHLSDEAVVALVSRSDELALAELYDRYAAAAYGLARRIVRDPALAEDVVQDALLAVWRGADRFVPERASAASWLMTIVHRRAVDVVRREERRRSDVLDEERTGSLVGEGSTEQTAWLNLERERVQAALARLPDAQRELLELAYYGGFTQSQLAVRLGRPIGTIKSQMFAALSHLRQILDPSSSEGSWKTT
jgi:RNA polymerase sigma-70 factor (ECF subfamily)